MSAEARLSLAISAYVAIQLAIRLLVGPALELDEAEAFYFSQELAWGYGPQPPLYFWLQWGLFQVLGENLFALATLKALLLGGTLVSVLAALRRELPVGAAAAAVVSLALLPQVVWEAHRALTHSVLALLMAALALGTFARTAGSGRWRDYLALGLVLGLGLLSKFNFALWAAAMLIAAMVLPEWRVRLRPDRLGVGLGVAAALAAPVLLWMWRHPDLATESITKFDIAESGGLAARAEGTASLLTATLSFNGLGLLLLGGLAVATWRRSRSAGSVTPILRLMTLAAVVALGLIWAGILISATTEVRDRWLLPVAWTLVPAGTAALWLRLGPLGRRVLVGVPSGIWVLAAAALPYASLVDPGYRGMDWMPLAARLTNLEAPKRPVVVVGTLIAGNLALLRPELAPRLLTFAADLPSGETILVARSDNLEPWNEAIARRVDHRFELGVPRGDRMMAVTILVLSARS